MKTKRILLTGASGSIGSEVLKYLLEVPAYEVIVFDIASRKTEKLFNSLEGNFTVITGDLSREEDIAKIPGGLDVVIHLGAVIPPAADEFPELTRKVNIIGTRLLVAHLEKTSPEAFFIYSSSVSVYGDRVKSPDIYVTDPVNISDGDFYGETKYEAEKIIRESALQWTIFRLSAIMKSHKISKLMFHMPLDTTLEFTTAADAALAFANAGLVPDKLRHRIFNLGGGEQTCLSYREFLQRSFKIYGLGKLNFPRFAFATRNYHCGRMADGDELEGILHFRRDTLETYFGQTQQTVSPVVRAITSVLSPVIKWSLLRQSEPYQAYKTRNEKLISRFFTEEDKAEMKV